MAAYWGKRVSREVLPPGLESRVAPQPPQSALRPSVCQDGVRVIRSGNADRDVCRATDIPNKGHRNGIVPAGDRRLVAWEWLQGEEPILTLFHVYSMCAIADRTNTRTLLFTPGIRG
jgi:hypothetical protein